MLLQVPLLVQGLDLLTQHIHGMIMKAYTFPELNAPIKSSGFSMHPVTETGCFCEAVKPLDMRQDGWA
jgi:hypothetical protein